MKQQFVEGYTILTKLIDDDHHVLRIIRPRFIELDPATNKTRAAPEAFMLNLQNQEPAISVV